MAHSQGRFNPLSGLQHFLKKLGSGGFRGQGLFQSTPQITGRGVGGPVQPPEPTRIDRPRTPQPGQGPGQAFRQLPARPQFAPGGPITGPPNPSVSAGAQQELEQFTFPGGNVLKFTAGSPPATALRALVDTIVGSGLPSADIYAVIGARPEDQDNFMQALMLRWQEALAASFGDPDAALAIFQDGLVRDATPLPETFNPEDFGAGSADAGVEGAPLPVEEFDPADFFIDPSLLYSSTTSGEDFF